MLHGDSRTRLTASRPKPCSSIRRRRRAAPFASAQRALLLMQTAQTAACNRVHELPERLARWILMCADRIEADHAPVTQDLLAMMLGTRRSSISVAASALQDAGLISWTRGRMTIQDHAGLVKAACECYGSSTTSTCGWGFFRKRRFGAASVRPQEGPGLSRLERVQRIDFGGATSGEITGKPRDQQKNQRRERRRCEGRARWFCRARSP